ncbi:MAG: CDP-glycerol:poly(glycerophosphate) glycerophosphotransferase [Friedmanniella sp.]|nr:CDP-glycerol:poly(glycerophosphate) glycerophosphotransferase [Friedmanniella sp.]
MKVVYNSFNGRYSDNPRAIHEALLGRGGADEHVWLADPGHRHTFPAGVETVRIASPAAVAALESADVLVANCHTDLDTWRKRPETVYLQTWHGTPLKRIHRTAISQPPAELFDEMDNEIARWDYLITPSRAGTDLLRTAFGYPGRVLETGYPRNDVLNAPDREQRRAKIRAELGLTAEHTAILYAPTYRDDEATVGDVALGLDLDALARSLGPTHVLLMRRHYFLGGRTPVPHSDQVRDLSAYPDISDLYLAADVLVTDYSSVLFDFAVTGKPIVLVLYDLEHYRDRLRGFTLDLVAEAPGPMPTDQAGLTGLLSDIPALIADYGPRYAAFRERYCHLDDGRATQRVVDALWPA